MIWLPESVYKSVPWLCFTMATIALFLPPHVAKVICITYLYCYTFFIIYKRSNHANH